MAGHRLKPGWKVWRFDQMAINVNDRIDNPSEADVEHYVGLEHLDPDSLRIRRWGVPSDVEATKLCFREGDIIFGRRRVYQRKLAVAEFDGICSAHAMVLRPKTDVVLPEFLPFFMQSDLFMNRALEISVGSLSPTINWKTLAAQEFALPPLEEQRRLGRCLNALQLLYDNLLAASVAAKQTRLAISLRLFMEDTHASKKLEYLIKHTRYGPRFGAELYDDAGQVAQIRTTDFDEDGRISYSTIPRARLDPTQYAEHLLRNGDVVISRSGTCGLTTVFHEFGIPTVAAAFLILLRVDEQLIVPDYLHEFFSSPIGRQLTTSLARGGVQKNINGSELLAQQIPCPSLDRQYEVVGLLNRARETEDSTATRIVDANKIRQIVLSILTEEAL